MEDFLVVFTKSPPAVQCIPWPDESLPSGAKRAPTRTTLLDRLDWILRDKDEKEREPAYVSQSNYCSPLDLFVWITSDGRAYFVELEVDSRTAIWRGKCFHGLPARRQRSSTVKSYSSEEEKQPSRIVLSLSDDDKAVCASVNARFSLLAVGLQSGTVITYTYRAFHRSAPFSHRLSIREALRSTASYLATGKCSNIKWSSDGHALAVGWELGWSVWSTFGKLMGCSLTENWQDASTRFSDHFMQGVQDLFWGPGNTDLFLLRKSDSASFDPDMQLFVLPFAKSAVTGQHSPDNTRYAFIQLDDSVLVYRGSDQPDMSIINPESDVWHNIKIPQSYLAANWPIRYASISSDGRLIAVAGRRGLTHFSTLSGRWKQYQQLTQEQNFSVQGGLQWYQHVLVVACHVPTTNEHQIRLYSRDASLDDSSILYIEQLPSAVVLTSLFDNSLLVYTADNTLHHFLIAILQQEIRLTLCGSITFEGVVGEPARVRGMSWLVPYSQQHLGDPMDDLMVATIIFLIDGKLVLLRPRRSNAEDEEEVSYDMQILGDQIEYYWTHLQGIGTLENSLWGYDGRGIKLWLDALTIEQADVISEEDDEDDKPEYKTIAESLSIPLDFYPLCVLIEKGIVIGVDPEVSLRRSLDFAIFRSTTNTQLFLQHVLRNYLSRSQMKEAVLFASFYKDLVYFSHTLEILLHDVLEDEADTLSPPTLTTSSSSGSIIEHGVPSPPSDLPSKVETNQVYASNGDTAAEDGRQDSSLVPQERRLLPHIIAFLDHFDEALEVVVNCARKTEVARWSYLFSYVGQPRDLFELCIQSGNYKTAGSYLLVLHNLESLDESRSDTVRLLRLAREHGWQNLCKDLLRFLRSLDEDGWALQSVAKEAGFRDEKSRLSKTGDDVYSPQNFLGVPQRQTSAPSLPRTYSAPNVLDMPIQEEEENEAQSPPQANGGSPQRSYSLFSNFTPEIHAPKASLGKNGRILTAPVSPLEGRRSSISGGSSHERQSTGLGMSLSKVGIRSSDRVWDSSA